MPDTMAQPPKKSTRRDRALDLRPIALRLVSHGEWHSLTGPRKKVTLGKCYLEKGLTVVHTTPFQRIPGMLYALDIWYEEPPANRPPGGRLKSTKVLSLAWGYDMDAVAVVSYKPGPWEDILRKVGERLK